MANTHDIMVVLKDVADHLDCDELRTFGTKLAALAISRMQPDVFWLTVSTLLEKEIRVGLTRSKAEAIVRGDETHACGSELVLQRIAETVMEMRERGADV